MRQSGVGRAERTPLSPRGAAPGSTPALLRDQLDGGDRGRHHEVRGDGSCCRRPGDGRALPWHVAHLPAVVGGMPREPGPPLAGPEHSVCHRHGRGGQLCWCLFPWWGGVRGRPRVVWSELPASAALLGASPVVARWFRPGSGAPPASKSVCPRKPGQDVTGAASLAVGGTESLSDRGLSLMVRGTSGYNQRPFALWQACVLLKLGGGSPMSLSRPGVRVVRSPMTLGWCARRQGVAALTHFGDFVHQVRGGICSPGVRPIRHCTKNQQTASLRVWLWRQPLTLST